MGGNSFSFSSQGMHAPGWTLVSCFFSIASLLTRPEGRNPPLPHPAPPSDPPTRRRGNPRPRQYTPYSRVNSVMAFTFSTLESFCMMALASMM